MPVPIYRWDDLRQPKSNAINYLVRTIEHVGQGVEPVGMNFKFHFLAELIKALVAVVTADAFQAMYLDCEFVFIPASQRIPDSFNRFRQPIDKFLQQVPDIRFLFE